MKNDRNPVESETAHTPFSQTYFHGTKAGLRIGDYITTGVQSNFGSQRPAKYIYLSARLDAAVWGAEIED